MSKELKGRLFTIAKIVFATVLFIVVATILYREIAHMDFKKAFILFEKLNRVQLTGVFAIGAASILLLSFYDFIMVRTLKLTIPLGKIFRISYIINALNSIIGFGGFIGAGMRLAVYRNYTKDTKTLMHYISLVLLSMLTGLSFLSILVVTHIFNASHLLYRYPAVHIMMYVVALFLPAFIIFTIKKPVQQNHRLTGVYLTMVSAVEWIAASTVLYFSLRVVHLDVPYTSVIGIFIIAAIAGLISFIPGGFGAFDVVILVGLKHLGLPEEKILLGLLMYRFAYYFIPLLISMILSIFEFGTSARRYIEQSRYYTPAKEVTSFLFSYQKAVVSKIPSLSLGILVAFTSLMFLLNNVSIIYDGLYDPNHMFYYIIVTIHTSACLILMLNVRGIFKQSRRAILFALFAIIIIFAITLYMNTSVLLMFWLVVLFALLVYSFNKTPILKRPLRLRHIVAMFFVSAGMLILNHYIIKLVLNALDAYKMELDNSLLRYYLWLTALVIFILVAFIVWLFEQAYSKERPQPDFERCTEIIQQYGGNYLSHLIYSGDKEVFMDESEEAFVMYRYKSNALVVLGDPIGNPERFHHLLETIYDYAVKMGYEVIFYQASDRYMPLYHDFGNQFFKLGEEAVIDLTTFTTSGKKRRGFRATLNKIADQEIQFEIIEPPFSPELMKQLKHVSDAWLDGKNEMHFSVGQFTDSYISKAPVGILKEKDGRIIAFSSLMPTHYNDSFSVDLIRWLPDVDLPLMDGLYLHLLLWGQEHDYKAFNMGMATLSNVGQTEFSYLNERIAGRIFENFNNLYRFRGLRQYKEKFKPHWEPRYLVYSRHSSLWQNMLKVLRVIRSKQ
ncbi:oxacillin resistance-related FmtC protein [Staphylococcus piscifermentans]|uniref:Phosphatidylglycerol lysyltransferase n=1 Tax=Staphylococcus piscifermentans TaxID=70258 RepID=A0A239U4M5_9STAP|nr:bifunctional lysylphosphatidylglycerol flippase/synthetase MprF [Staphylococcus piscifermentans]RTX86562.1 bifunctional lysylphosphatidylglycerol flippase/synthetase MprF [Staphylococcus piscifermentans]GEP83529.1 phosphatidylglycerol lysyltransferase [Staphylococcus piscifermentans]SNV04792.1 oxacillin resistance-related FmtC protein [Staphylococcus piscifermentans]